MLTRRETHTLKQYTNAPNAIPAMNTIAMPAVTATFDGYQHMTGLRCPHTSDGGKGSGGDGIDLCGCSVRIDGEGRGCVL